MDRDRYIEILEVYVVVLQALCLIHKYWNRMTMVERAKGYYGAPYKGYQGVTQGDPLFFTLFNMVVGTVVQNWLSIMVEETALLESF